MDLRILGMPGCWDFGSSHKVPLVFLCAFYHPQLPGRWPSYIAICTMWFPPARTQKPDDFLGDPGIQNFGNMPSWFENSGSTVATLEVDCSLLHAAVGTFFAVSQLEIWSFNWRGCLARGEYYLCGVDLSKAVCWCYPCKNLAKEKYTHTHTHTCHIAMDIMKRKHICKWLHFHRYVRLLEGT